jgi:hypothetical protein
MKRTNLEFVYGKISFPWFYFVTFTVSDYYDDAGGGCIPLFCALFIDFVIGVWKEKGKPFYLGPVQVTKFLAMKNLQVRSSLILCFSLIVPCFIPSHNSFCISQFLALLRFHSSFPFIVVYTFICFSSNNFPLLYVYYNTTSCYIPNSIKYSSWI